MNINEDKFANKSAEEIISDMLTQHKNNSKEALEHIQDILKDDGLVLSKDVKTNLEQAVNILSDKGLKEGWFTKKPTPTLETVNFEVYLPFRDEPARFATVASSLDDPQVKEAIQKIRAKHPKSTIYIRSNLGNKTITEEKDKDPSLLSQFLSSNFAKGLAGIGLTAATGGAIQPVFSRPITNAILNKAARKTESTDYKIHLYKNKTPYTCYVGTLPIALTLAENAKDEYTKIDVLKENKVICSYDKTLKEWSTNTTDEDELKEDLTTPEDITQHSFVNDQKDIADIEERKNLILCGLNPNLIDKRKPKWRNIFVPKPEYGATGDEIMVVLNGVDPVINTQNPGKTRVTILKKVPSDITEEGSLVYKDGEEYVITANQFKKLLQDPQNAEILEKFEKAKGPAILSDESKEEFLELDKLAKTIIDNKYPNWEKTHWDEYKLYNYTLPERANIYLKYKDLNRDTMYQTARELTPEEVDLQFGRDKIKKQFASDKAYSKYLQAFDTVKKMISDEDKVELDNELFDILNNDDDIKATQEKISKIIGYFGAKTQLNQIPTFKGALSKISNDLPVEAKEQFENELSQLVKDKYVDTKTGLPTIAKNLNSAIKDITTLINKYKSNTNSSVWSKNVGTTKELTTIVKEIKSTIAEVNAANPILGKKLNNTFIGKVNTWKKDLIVGEELNTNLEKFLNYSKQVLDIANNPKEVEDDEILPFDNKLQIKNKDSDNDKDTYAPGVTLMFKDPKTGKLIDPYIYLKKDPTLATYFNTQDTPTVNKLIDILKNGIKQKDANNKEIVLYKPDFPEIEDMEIVPVKLDLSKLTHLVHTKDLPASDEEKLHSKWLNKVKHIKNPESTSKTDPSYYNAITNKISRLVKTDPTSANGYNSEFKKLLDDMENKNLPEEEITVKLSSFLNTIKDETHKPATTSGQLQNAIVNSLTHKN